jgi:hypothetical protein
MCLYSLNKLSCYDNIQQDSLLHNHLKILSYCRYNSITGTAQKRVYHPFHRLLDHCPQRR